jgi:hypothetical protein
MKEYFKLMLNENYFSKIVINAEKLNVYLPTKEKKQNISRSN